MNLADLKAPFAPNKISWRIGSTNADKTKGMALAYIDARDVQDRLDEVLGVDGWQCRYIPMHDKKTVCEIGVRFYHESEKCEFEWIWKSDGAGDSDIEAEKGALSDAFKRAAVRWGVGRYLYDLDSPWVEIKAAGRSFKIADHEYARLEKLLASGPKPTQREAIHGPSTMKDEQGDGAGKNAGPNKALNARVWALGEVPRIKTMDRMALDKFSERFAKARTELKALDPKTSVELEKALADRLEALFA